MPNKKEQLLFSQVFQDFTVSFLHLASISSQGPQGQRGNPGIAGPKGRKVSAVYTFGLLVAILWMICM